MHLIGKLDKEIYKCIEDTMITDDVIITDERVEHIINRRGQEFYEKYSCEFKNIIENPDYIFEDKENTLLVCKEFLTDGKFVNLVIRVAVVQDNVDYKNSILTAIGENKKRFQQRLRNHEPLYRRE